MIKVKSHCHFCGGPLRKKFIEGRKRLFCEHCGRTIYENPIPATCVIVSDANGQLLLVKRSVAPKKGWWCLPGGFIELGEDPQTGAIRELAEETGLIACSAQLISVCTTPSTRYQSILMIGYTVSDYRGVLRPGDDASTAKWFGIDQLPAIAFGSHRYFIQRFLDRQKKSPPPRT